MRFIRIRNYIRKNISGIACDRRLLIGMICMAICIFLSLNVTGCGKMPESALPPSGGADSGYSFRFNDIDIEINEDPSEVIDLLGNPINYYEGASCVFDGMAKLYTYPDFEMEVYSENGSDIVSAIILKDDLVSTREGVFIGDSRGRVTEIYGDSYEEGTGFISYTKDETMLRFILRDDAVAAIEYRTVRE